MGRLGRSRLTGEELKANFGIDPDNISEDAWQVKEFHDDGVTRTDILWIQEPRDGKDGISIERKVNIFEHALFEANREEYEDDQGFIRNNGTPLDAKVASIPLNVYYNELVPAIKEGDEEHVKWWLKQDENRKYKTQKGTF